MKNSLKIKRMVGYSILGALALALQFIATYFKFGNLSINLGLIAIAIGAILYGPTCGLVMGLLVGFVCIVDPATLASFMPYNAFMTIVLCLLKTGLAGYAAGWMYRLFSYIGKKTNHKYTLSVTGSVISNCIIPVINTGLFILGASLFFTGVFGVDNFKTALPLIFGLVITTNFLVEFLIVALLSPVIVLLVKILTRKYNLGFANDFSHFDEKELDENVEE